MKNLFSTALYNVSLKKIRINWAALLAFAIFWLWGMNSYPAGSNLNNFAVNSLIVLLFGYFIFHCFSSNFQSLFVINAKAISIIIFLLALITVLSWEHLNQPLWGDQIYHANLAARQGQLAIFMIEKNYPSLWLEVKNWPASLFIWICNCLLAVWFAFLFVYLPHLLKRHKKLLVVLMVSILILCRFMVSGEGNLFSSISEPTFLLHYDWDPHPVLRLLPLLLSSTIFGSFDFGYRWAGYLGYLLFLTFLFIRLEARVGWRLGVIAMVAIGSLPIFWHVAYLVEQSIWSTLASSVILVWLFSSRDVDEIPLIPIVSLVVLATLMRSPAFIAFGPVIIIIAQRFFNRSIARSDYFPLFAISLALLLFVLISVLRGSPATESEGGFTKWVFAQINNIPAIAGVSVLGLTPLFFIGFTFKVINRDDAIKFLAILSFYILGGLVFYAPVARSLWGVGRYQAEMFVPLVVAGVVAYCVVNVDNKTKLNLWLTAAPLLTLIVINCFSLLTFDHRIYRPFTENPTPGEAIKSEVEYPMNLAFKFIREHGLQESTFYVGIYNGGYIAALMGFTATDYLAFTRLNNQYRNGFLVNVDAVNADPRINSVVLEADADSGVLQGLIDRGWKGRYHFTQKNSNHKMIILTRELLQ